MVSKVIVIITLLKSRSFCVFSPPSVHIIAERKGSGKYIYYWLMPAHHHPLGSIRLIGSSNRAKAADAASGEGDLSDKVCETADDPATFKYDVWKHFGFVHVKK